MHAQRLGAVVRAVRIRRGWRQLDLAERARVSQATVSRLERGHVEGLAVGTVEAIAAALDIRVDLVPRWRGADLDRLLNAGHSAMHDGVARWFGRRWPDWMLSPEVTFSIYGERGIIDILAWHGATRSLLVIELKTAFVDVNEMAGTADRKRRLGPIVARDRGWHALRTGLWVIVARGRTNERHGREHEAFLGAAFPDDAAAIRRWLRNPQGAVAAVSLESFGAERHARAPRTPSRVRRSGVPSRGIAA